MAKGRETVPRDPFSEEYRAKKVHQAKALTRDQMRQRDAQMYELRLSGWTYEQIADHFNLRVGTVQNVITKRLTLRVQPLIEHLREVELDRLDKYLLALDPKIKNGDDRAINTALRIAERRAKILGIDSMLKVAPNGELVPNSMDMELQEMINEAKAAQAAQTQKFDASAYDTKSFTEAAQEAERDRRGKNMRDRDRKIAEDPERAAEVRRREAENERLAAALEEFGQ